MDPDPNSDFSRINPNFWPIRSWFRTKEKNVHLAPEKKTDLKLRFVNLQERAVEQHGQQEKRIGTFFANCKYSPNNFFLIINFSLTQKLFFQVPIHTRQVFWGRSTTGLVRFIAKPVEIALSLLHGVCFLDLFDKSLVKVLKLSLGSLCVGPLKLILTIIF